MNTTTKDLIQSILVEGYTLLKQIKQYKEINETTYPNKINNKYFNLIFLNILELSFSCLVRAFLIEPKEGKKKEIEVERTREIIPE